MLRYFGAILFSVRLNNYNFLILFAAYAAFSFCHITNHFWTLVSILLQRFPPLQQVFSRLSVYRNSERLESVIPCVQRHPIDRHLGSEDVVRHRSTVTTIWVHMLFPFSVGRLVLSIFLTGSRSYGKLLASLYSEPGSPTVSPAKIAAAWQSRCFSLTIPL